MMKKYALKLDIGGYLQSVHLVPSKKDQALDNAEIVTVIDYNMAILFPYGTEGYGKAVYLRDLLDPFGWFEVVEVQVEEKRCGKN